jgi:hypothetical protein
MMVALFKKSEPERSGASDNGSSQNKQAESVTPEAQAAYAAALTTLGDKHAAGELDKDLAAAAARRLGRAYHERYVAPPAAADKQTPKIREGQTAKIKQALDAASRVQARLLGKRSTSAEGLRTEVDISAQELQRCLQTLVHALEQSAGAQGASGQVLLTGWEKAVIESAGRLQAAARNAGNLAREHERIAADYKAAFTDR